MVDESKEINDNDAKVREDREKAEEYGRRVLSGEEPWKDEESDVTDTAPDGGPQPETAGDTVPVKNDDVGETESDAPEVIEVDDEEVNKPADEKE